MEAYEQGKCEQVSRVPAGSCVSWRSWQQLGESCFMQDSLVITGVRAEVPFMLLFCFYSSWLCWWIASQTSDFFRRELLSPLSQGKSSETSEGISHLTASGLGQGGPNLLASSFSWSHWNGLLFFVIFAPRGFVPHIHWVFAVQHVQMICKSLLWHCWEQGMGCLAHSNSPHKSCSCRIQQPSKYFDCKQEQICHS